jgi:outer membrane receptor protein involved in Fe transport
VILTIDNVTDEAPPEVGNDIGPTAWNSGNTYPTVYDALGRTYSLGVTLKF